MHEQKGQSLNPLGYICFVFIYHNSQTNLLVYINTLLRKCYNKIK